MAYNYKKYLKGMITEQEELNNFRKAIENDIIPIKLMKYKYFFKKIPKQAMLLKQQMLALALDNKLVSQYQQIHKLLNMPLQKQGKYKQLRQQFIQNFNPLATQLNYFQSIDNKSERIKCLKKIIDLYIQSGNHQQASNRYKDLFKEQIQNWDQKQKMQHLSNWAAQMFYCQNYIDMGVFFHWEIQNNVKKNYVDIAMIQDIRQIHCSKPHAFENVINLGFKSLQILNNKLMSVDDMGFLYSMYTLAFCDDRNLLRRDIRWSSRLQLPYLRGQYNKFFQQFDSKRIIAQFNPLIDAVLKQCFQKITFKIFREILLAYKRISLDKIQQMTGFTKNYLCLFAKKNPNLPILYDPVTQSFVHREDAFSLDSTLAGMIKKYEETVDQYWKSKLSASIEPENENRKKKKRNLGYQQP